MWVYGGKRMKFKKLIALLMTALLLFSCTSVFAAGTSEASSEGENLVTVEEEQEKVEENISDEEIKENKAEIKSERKQSRQSDIAANTTRQTSQQRPVSSSIVPTIAIKEPAAYDNIMESARVIRNGESVLVNFKNMGDQQARRSIDFLTGVVFTLDGDIQNVGGQIFLLTPNGMTVDAEKELSILAGRNFEGLDTY